jgi:hypothetical protein
MGYLQERQNKIENYGKSFFEFTGYNVGMKKWWERGMKNIISIVLQLEVQEISTRKLYPML